jgi:hypothetical protein
MRQWTIYPSTQRNISQCISLFRSLYVVRSHSVPDIHPGGILASASARRKASVDLSNYTVRIYCCREWISNSTRLRPEAAALGIKDVSCQQGTAAHSDLLLTSHNKHLLPLYLATLLPINGLRIRPRLWAWWVLFVITGQAVWRCAIWTVSCRRALQIEMRSKREEMPKPSWEK